MSRSLEDLKIKIAANQKAFDAIHEGSSNAVDSFNLLLDELFNPKLMKVYLTGTQEIQDERLMIHVSLVWSAPATHDSPGGWQNNKVGSIVREYPVPPADEVCKWINGWINVQMASQYSPLVVALSHLSGMYSAHTRKKLLER